jgi:SAM-dependent methyltransferase
MPSWGGDRQVANASHLTALIPVCEIIHGWPGRWYFREPPPPYRVYQLGLIAQGHEIMTARWHDDDRFWAAIAPFLFTDERCGAAASEVESLVRLLEIEPGSRILDLCCGVGRHSLELARRGFSVTAVDRTAAYLERARKEAHEQGLAIELVRAGMEEFCRPGAFDAATNLFTSFGFFDSDAEELAVLRNVLASLKPGGRFVIDVMGKEVISRRFQPRTWQAAPGGAAFLLEERTVRSGWAYLENRWIIFDEAGRHEFHFNIRVYSGRELEDLIRQAGYRDVALFGNLNGAPYDHDAERLVAVARK